jgi:hypothetical protein
MPESESPAQSSMKHKNKKPKRRKEERKLRMEPWGRHNQNDLFIYLTKINFADANGI